MNQKKYYAVKEGRAVGVYDTWDECRKQVDGYSGAIFKKFTSYVQAKNYLGCNDDKIHKNIDNHVAKREVIAYVDGSYSDELKKYSYGCLILGNEKTTLLGTGENIEFISMRNVAGEVKGVVEVIKWALQNKYDSIVIYHDYEGIARWANGEWRAKRAGTKEYVKFINNHRQSINIEFRKVKAHSGDVYNEEANRLAGEALSKLYLSDIEQDSSINISSLEEYRKLVDCNSTAGQSVVFRIKDYHFTEGNLKRVGAEVWKGNGNSIYDINAINASVDIAHNKIEYQIIDLDGVVNQFDLSIN